MKKHIFDRKEASGKTLADILFSWDDCILLVFTDDTFLHIKLYLDADDDICKDLRKPPNLLNFDEYELIKSGMMTGEEILAAQAELQRQQKEIRRLRYQELKKEFDDA